MPRRCGLDRADLRSAYSAAVDVTASLGATCLLRLILLPFGRMLDRRRNLAYDVRIADRTIRILNYSARAIRAHMLFAYFVIAISRMDNAAKIAFVR